MSNWWYLIVLVIAFLFFGSHIVPIGLTGLALLLLPRMPTGKCHSDKVTFPLRIPRSWIRWDFAAMALSVVLLGCGYVAATTFPPPDKSAMGGEVQWQYLSQQPARLLRLLTAAIANWTISPLFGPANSNDDMSRTNGAWLGSHIWIALALLAAIIATLAYLTSPKRTTAAIRVPTGLLFLSIIAFQTAVTVRGFGHLESSLARRYDPSLLLTIAILWAVVTMTPTRTRPAKTIQVFLIGLIAVSTIWSIWNFPSTVRNASFQPRIAEARAVQDALSRCQLDAEFPPFSSIQQTVVWEVCNLWLRFNTIPSSPQN
jgi:hypothetical protein